MTFNKPKTRGLFITGTDTAVGKTTVTQLMLNQLSAQSISCVAMKPVASGASQTASGLRNADALKLQQASNIDVPYELINPYCFEPAIAPHLAAELSGVAIQSSLILDCFQELTSLADIVLVEGVGGWQVPLNIFHTGQDNFGKENLLTVASLAEQLQLPVVLVVGLRLGCLNHALLTTYSIYSSQCRLAGWIANTIEREFISANECSQTLQQQIAAPLLANLAWCDDITQHSYSSAVFDLDQLLMN